MYSIKLFMGFNLIYWTRISGSYFLKHVNFFEKRPFFRADMAGFGKYCMGGYGRIGVYRVKATCREIPDFELLFKKPMVSVLKGSNSFHETP